MKETIKVCHFSDLHLVPEQTIPLFKLLNKRMLGYANLRLNRGRTHRLENLRHLIESAANEAADRVVITGDFTSLALEFEFEMINRLFLDSGLCPENTLIVPGNHDRYTVYSDIQNSFEQGLSEWFPRSFKRASGYPIIIDDGPVRLIGLDTAVWRNPVRAAGAISWRQIQRLAAALNPVALGERWPVIAMHHPPYHLGNRNFMHYRTGLAGFQRFLEHVRRPATVIHGHLHIASRLRADNIDIIGVPSASNDTGLPATQFAYHTYVFDKTGLKSGECVRFWPQRNGIVAERTPLLPMEPSAP